LPSGVKKGYFRVSNFSWLGIVVQSMYRVRKIWFSCFVISLLAYNTARPQNINIRVYSDVELQSFYFSVIQGKYDIISNQKVLTRLEPGDSVYVARDNNVLTLKKGAISLGEFSFLQFRGIYSTNIFMLLPSRPFVKQRVYDDDIYVECTSNAIKVVNDVNFERYIAGVIESEGGHMATPEYYKVQAILCRTYALKYYEKHLKDGHNLCDKVHCQAYYGRCTKNIDIQKASQETTGLVIVDSSLSVISATFFSNSGGETVNSEDIWMTPIPYLRAIKDTFSLRQPNAAWVKRIPYVNWTNYLKSKGLIVTDTTDTSFCHVPMVCRQKSLSVGTRSVLYKDIRKDLNLKSSFFDIEKQGDTILLRGKGYGHGVGLSQEGAMNMARQGYSYENIIKFYYTNILIMNVKNIDFFKIE
jgi:stage II sporulation protein D